MARDRQRAKLRKAKRLKQKQQAGGRAERSAKEGTDRATEPVEETTDVQALEATTALEKETTVERVAPKPAPTPAPKQKEKAREGPRGRGRVLTFLGEVRGELKRVQWPDRQALAQGTAVVIAAVLIAGTYLWLFDLIWNEMVKQLL